MDRCLVLDARQVRRQPQFEFLMLEDLRLTEDESPVYRRLADAIAERIRIISISQ